MATQRSLRSWLPATYEFCAPRVCMMRAGTHNMLQSFRFCQLLAASLTEWHATFPEEPLQLHGVQHLSTLTKLTRLTLKDNAAVGALTELKHLRQLQSLTLTSYMESPFQASSLTNIQKLILCSGTAQTVNLSCCTQLTCLSIGNKLQTINLPQGDSVQLHALYMTGEEGSNPFPVMSNLSCASRLVTLCFNSFYPSNLRQGDWPLCMLELQAVTLMDLDCQPPQQLCQYPKLRNLDLFGLVQSDLPAWFAELTQITSLRLTCSKLTAFPSAIIQLLHLCTLHLDNIEPPMVIGLEISSILNWKFLQDIDLSPHEGPYSLDFQLYLLECIIS